MIRLKGFIHVYQHSALVELSRTLINNPDRYEAHDKAKPTIEQLCLDREFLHEALRGLLSDPKHLHDADYLRIPLLYSGDIIISINLFCPIRDGGKNITLDNIHHHGWRLLTTGVMSGDGYETINFTRNSHESRVGSSVKLKIEEIYRHVAGEVRFIDSEKPHVVFHNQSLCSTLAVWSADRVIASQGIKRHFKNFPMLQKWAVKATHATGLNHAFGLNQLSGLYYHPENGKIVETLNYNKPFDGDRADILRCWFKFFQQVEFDDADYWRGLQKNAPHEAFPLIEMLVSGAPIPDIGIWGNLRRRFSKTQILQALDHSIPGDVF
jgi:hypothetical protein